MASQPSQQYAFRAQKTLGLTSGSPSYTSLEGIQAPDVPARTYRYSDDGRLYAYALPTCVRIFLAEGAQLVRQLDLPNALEIDFSPRGTYLSVWERPAKLEDGAQHKNHRVFSVSTGEELIAFSQKAQEGWDLQYTISESHAIRLVGADIQVYRPAEWSKGIADKLRVEGATSIALSPGLNPSVAVFVAEKKGQPASVKIYGLLSLSAPPTCQKSFFKADRAQIKWNTLGTQVLVLTQTEVDNSGKSYYGETGGFYLLSAAGNFDLRLTLDKEGGIHDFNWSPNSKEFVVIYGFMPAKAALFDQRGRLLHDFGNNFYNFASFNSHGRLVALGGFGNLRGTLDIFDRRSLTKVTTIDAANASFCQWSPDGRFILTATLSPRLRVDNGIKIWHCTGGLMHVESIDELYQASWRPIPVDQVPQFGQTIPSAPAPHPSVLELTTIRVVTPVKTAYRPPGARGLEASSAYRREDSGGSGQNTPTRRHSPGPTANGRRYVPGAPKSPSPKPDGVGGPGKKKQKNKGDKGLLSPGLQQQPEQNGRRSVDVNGGRYPPPPPIQQEESADMIDPTLDANAKKVRNLNKKLKAIEELKEKAKRGERLEATQLKKIDTEAEIRKELAELSVS
ncbi:translation initiation factor eIF-2A [Thelephora ganbajun]|uniref:Translation initiation factor eIF-2A n=1 Tax=Thelephora ganbajun TaxID=370292 RepID=A0ACB6ZWD7_THEGA|nr:translation initiation factor eIF-2A [Thelephora ganbajun]